MGCSSLSSQWLEMRPSRQQCPVCKAGISREKVIPLYGRGSASQEDPRYHATVAVVCAKCFLHLLTLRIAVQVENSTSTSGTERGTGEQRRGQ